MKRIFQNPALNAACLILVGIAALFFYFNKTETLPVADFSDLSAYAANDHAPVVQFYGKSVISSRPLPSFKIAMEALHYKLTHCKTDIDSLDTYAAFIYRVFDFGGTRLDIYPSESWRDFEFEEMYSYAQLDSGGTFCGQRTQALEKLLRAEGFADMIEYNVMRWHTFLLVRTRNDRAWITDGHGLWGVTVNGTRADFLTYLQAAKAKPETVKCINLPPVFGLPDYLADETFMTNPTNLGYLDTITENPVCDSCKGNNIAAWFANYVFLTEDTNRFKFKFALHRNFTTWAAAQIPGRSATTLWLAPDSVAKTEYYLPAGTDTGWANKVVHKIEVVKNKNL